MTLDVLFGIVSFVFLRNNHSNNPMPSMFVWVAMVQLELLSD